MSPKKQIRLSDAEELLIKTIRLFKVAPLEVLRKLGINLELPKEMAN